MKVTLGLFLIVVVLAVTHSASVPSRVRRQFDWGWEDNENIDSPQRPTSRPVNPQWPTNGQENLQRPTNRPGNPQRPTNRPVNPQRPTNRPTSPQRPSSSTQTSSGTGTTTTTPSPRYSACLANCPGTPEYNPVCGSDRVTYHNEGRLRCAVRCGLNVQKLFGGTCSPL